MWIDQQQVYLPAQNTINLCLETTLFNSKPIYAY